MDEVKPIGAKRVERESSELIRLSWEEFGREIAAFADGIRERYTTELVVGIARGGVIVGAVVASRLEVDFFPIKISRRVMMEVTSEEPAFIIKPYSYAEGKRVLLVDDVYTTGQTMLIARRALQRYRPAELRTCTYACREDAPSSPDFWYVKTPATIAFPWDYHLLR